jgi:hypothetical protein
VVSLHLKLNDYLGRKIQTAFYCITHTNSTVAKQDFYLKKHTTTKNQPKRIAKKKLTYPPFGLVFKQLTRTATQHKHQHNHHNTPLQSNSLPARVPTNRLQRRKFTTTLRNMETQYLLQTRRFIIKTAAYRIDTHTRKCPH